LKLGFLKPVMHNEKRVALLPFHIEQFENEIYIERGFGESVNICDTEYEKSGCTLLDRCEIFIECESLFSLKQIPPRDYCHIKMGQMIIGWINQGMTGSKFLEEQAVPKELIVVDLQNNHPSVYYRKQRFSINWIPPNFLHKNSFSAGLASTMHALLSHGIIVNSSLKAAVLGSGSVAQGAFHLISKLGADVRMFYRRTMNEFIEKINCFDIIINGIQLDNDSHILTDETQRRLKKGCLIIDAAADIGRTIEGIRYTTIDKPIYQYNNIYYYAVENSPSLLFRETSKYLSESFSKHVFRKDVKSFYDLVHQTNDCRLY
jgi:N5-(carboxyethyl)ornithine synthase